MLRIYLDENTWIGLAQAHHGRRPSRSAINGWPPASVDRDCRVGLCVTLAARVTC